jgi:succinate dehydrogenase/fumarate reductase cytochrome b subunit
VSLDQVRRTLPPLAALAYPALIWAGPAVSPLALVIAVGVPLLGLAVAQHIEHRRFPASRWIAFAVVGAPPLYALLGGWLDFQHALPCKGLHVWIAGWLTCAFVAWSERRQVAERPLVAKPVRLRFAHGISGAAITAFAAAHLVNHLAGLWGGDRHVALMHTLRTVYRHPVVEPVLHALIVFQVLSGIRLLVLKLPRVVDRIESLQVAAASYLLLFFASHVSAVLRARYLRHADTNWSWATDGLLTDPWSARLAPYYFLAIVALAVHGAAGIRSVMLHHGAAPERARTAFYVVTAAAAALAVTIMIGIVRNGQ